MRSSLFLIIFFITTSLFTTSVSYSQSWQKETNVHNCFIDELYSTIDDANDYLSVGVAKQSYISKMYPLIVKTNSNGDTLWTRTYNWVSGHFNHIIKTLDGNFMVLCQEYNPVEFQVYVMKINSNGDTLWTKRMGGVDLERGVKLTENISGEIYIAANTLSYGYGMGTNDIYIIKINTDGDSLWTRTYGTATNDVSTDITSTPDGGCVVSGCQYPDLYSDISVPIIMKYSSGGDIQWTKPYPQMLGNDTSFFDAMCPTHDGGYMMTCSSYYAKAGYKRVLVKLNSTGGTLWTKTYSDDHNENRFISLVEMNNHNLALTGTEKINGTYKMYMFTVGPSGDSITTTYFSPGSHTKGNEIRLINGKCILSGSTFALTNASNCFLVQEGGITNSIFSSTPQKVLILPYPNPANDRISFDLQNLSHKELKFSLTDAITIVSSQKIEPDGSKNFIYKTDHLPQGIYFYSFSSNEEIVSSGKLIIQR